jgi:hypothetical protein
MSSDQCAQNPDGSLKDLKDIQWFNDAEDAQPLPFPAAPAHRLGRGLHNKTMNWFSDAVACEKLDSDEEDLNAFAEPPKRKHAACASNIFGSATLLTLSSSNSFETLPVEESLDDDEDGSFKSDSGSESGEDSSEEPDLELIANDEVRIQPFSYYIECLPNIVAACQCSAEEDNCGSQPR